MLPGGLLDHAGFDDQEGKMTTNTRATAPRGAARRVPGERALRRKIIELCREMNATGLNQGTSGNISARDDDCMLITPSGIPYGTMKPEMIARMPVDDDTGAWEGPCRPSSEWHFHRAILRGNDDFGAVVHTHSTFATVLSMSRTTIPACHYMIAAFGARPRGAGLKPSTPGVLGSVESGVRRRGEGHVRFVGAIFPTRCSMDTYNFL